MVLVRSYWTVSDVPGANRDSSTVVMEGRGYTIVPTQKTLESDAFQV